MKKLICLILMLFLVLSINSFNVYAQSKKPLIQIAVLLDTSNSMDGLIAQAKSQLWKIVNELATAKRNGKSPDLEVALYEYGKDSIPSKEGYLRMIVPLSKDLDKISEELFGLKTLGGSEYCGKVIKSAVNGLQWNKKNNVLKMIFIAGNEPFTQGDVDYKKACKKAIRKGIIINTIFCGNHKVGINTKWKHGADLADGQYSNIDQNQKIAYIKAPQDKEIAKLGKKLNKTYIAYGSKGKKSKERQNKQDANAAGVAEEVMVQRSVSKASSQYYNATWDLVDADKEGSVDIDKLSKDQLPEEMKKMNKKERREYIEKKKKERKKIQKKINKLNEARKKYIAKKRKEMAKEDTLDQAVIKTIRKQAERKNFKFKK